MRQSDGASHGLAVVNRRLHRGYVVDLRGVALTALGADLLLSEFWLAQPSQRRSKQLFGSGGRPLPAVLSALAIDRAGACRPESRSRSESGSNQARRAASRR